MDNEKFQRYIKEEVKLMKKYANKKCKEIGYDVTEQAVNEWIALSATKFSEDWNKKYGSY